MGKPKLRPLPAILKLVESLSEDERADLRDYLRPAPKPRQKVQRQQRTRARRSKGEPCAKCGGFLDGNIHQLPTTEGYHEFVELAGEASKGVGV